MGYYVDETSNDKNYGIYDVFKGYTLKGNYETLGALGKDKYYFKTDVEDHYTSSYDLEDTIGEYGFYCTTKMLKADEFELTIGLFNDAYPNKFIMECVMGIISECIRFNSEYGKIKIKTNINHRLLLYKLGETYGLNAILEALREKAATIEEDKIIPAKRRFKDLFKHIKKR